MLTSQLEAIIAVNGMPEDRFERTEPTYSDTTTVSLSFGWFTPVYTRTLSDCVYGNPIGCIDRILLNRLEANVDYAARLFDEYAIGASGVSVRGVPWSVREYLYYADLLRIRNNITRIRNIGYIYPGTPKAPVINANGFPTYDAINAWEKCLLDMRNVLLDVKRINNRALGTFTLGTDYALQLLRR